MKPLTTGAIAALTLVFSRTLEQTGEILGETVMQQFEKAIKLLDRLSPETAEAIKRAEQIPDLAIEEPEDYGVSVLVEKVEQEANLDPELRAALEALAQEVEEAAKSDAEVAAALDALTEL
ncbi:MAG TPA: hypothetical protein V6C91_02740 [Coleofasciculaceae cyanobacterium]